MDEGRKRVLLIAASILAARKLAQYDSGPPVRATVSAIADAVLWVERIKWDDKTNYQMPALWNRPSREAVIFAVVALWKRKRLASGFESPSPKLLLQSLPR